MKVLIKYDCSDTFACQRKLQKGREVSGERGRQGTGQACTWKQWLRILSCLNLQQLGIYTMGANVVNQLIHTWGYFTSYCCCSLDFSRHAYYLIHLEEKTGVKLGFNKISSAEGISELVGTMFTVKHFAQASLPLLPQALPHILQRTCSTWQGWIGELEFAFCYKACTMFQALCFVSIMLNINNLLLQGFQLP